MIVEQSFVNFINSGINGGLHMREFSGMINQGEDDSTKWVAQI